MVREAILGTQRVRCAFVCSCAHVVFSLRVIGVIKLRPTPNVVIVTTTDNRE
jgi:hypothetical protein